MSVGRKSHRRTDLHIHPTLTLESKSPIYTPFSNSRSDNYEDFVPKHRYEEFREMMNSSKNSHRNSELKKSSAKRRKSSRSGGITSTSTAMTRLQKIKEKVKRCKNRFVSLLPDVENQQKPYCKYLTSKSGEKPIKDIASKFKLEGKENMLDMNEHTTTSKLKRLPVFKSKNLSTKMEQNYNPCVQI